MGGDVFHACTLEINGQSSGGVLRVRGLLRGCSITMAWGGGGSVKKTWEVAESTGDEFVLIYWSFRKLKSVEDFAVDI